MITISTWLWYQPGFRYEYTEDHVHALKEQIEQHVSVPYKFICFSDRSIDGVETYPFKDVDLKSDRWNPADQPQCFRRLWLFSEEVRPIVGDRFVNIDLDCEILSNIDSVLTRKEDFIIAKGQARRNGYSGSMWMMDTGSRSDVWNTLSQDGVDKATKLYVGSDQAWMRYVLGPDESLFEPSDGVYHYHYLRGARSMPEDAKIMFYAGRKKREHVKWI